MDETSTLIIPSCGFSERVISALLADPELKGVGIEVHTVGGVVALSGKVASEPKRSKAAQIAQGVEGARAVVNEWSIR